ncbi:MAG: 1-acyl-sn-glycerol-3-phosphate acyltransferase [Rhizobacter sp.]|nr:1-acyl-sn-glycerol-3-phosphate acyltransferase [Bacteriovorax sp.]
MKNVLEKRSPAFIGILHRTLWPVMKAVFSLKIEGAQNIPEKGPLLFISNHNSGAVVESHSVLFTLQDVKGSDFQVYGFTHPSIFKIPLMSSYFYLIGAVPASYEVAEVIFKTDRSLMIFPGGNRQALRPVWEYKINHFRWAHGWAKIAKSQNVPVIPVSFKGSHFINPVFLCNKWISKLLILPAVLGIKYAPVSLGQILCACISFFALKFFQAPMALNILLTYVIFIISPLMLVIPFPVKMKIYPAIIPSQFSTQESLEQEMGNIMDGLY